MFFPPGKARNSNVKRFVGKLFLLRVHFIFFEGGEGRAECDCESKYSANLPVPDKLMHTATAEKNIYAS